MINTCGGCSTEWTGQAVAHCAACRHRSAQGLHGTCLDPASLTDTHDRPVMRLVDGRWRGPMMPIAYQHQLQAADACSPRGES